MAWQSRTRSRTERCTATQRRCRKAAVRSDAGAAGRGGGAAPRSHGRRHGARYALMDVAGCSDGRGAAPVLEGRSAL
eukprot:351627-Chlamydomonas_euryale.AAC.2